MAKDTFRMIITEILANEKLTNFEDGCINFHKNKIIQDGQIT